MAEEKKHYFVYHNYHGITCCQTWFGEVTVNGKPMSDTIKKFEITEREFNLSVEDLKRIYRISDNP